VHMCMSLVLAPSPARDVIVDPKHPGELHISWQPPIKPNGEVTHYYVYWQPQPFQAEKYHQRNYCANSKSFPYELMMHSVSFLVLLIGRQASSQPLRKSDTSSPQKFCLEGLMWSDGWKTGWLDKML